MQNVAVTYNRYSPGPNQREESITGQMRENHRLAEQKGLKVIHDYIDRSLTGKVDDRPQFQQMIRDAEKGLFQYIICYQTARFARNSYDAIIYKKKLKKLGVKVIYSKMSIPEGPEGIILERVLEALDEYYSEELRQKVVRGQYDNALQGKASGGPVPYGLKLNEAKQFIIDEDTAPIIREIFNRYIAGEKAIDIINDFNQRGLRTSKGKEFNKNSLHRILNNPKYYGLLHFESKDEDYEPIDKLIIPPIIDKETFLKAQMRLNMNKHKTSKKPIAPIDFILSGKIYDGACGGALVGDSGTSKTGNTYYYYTCQNKKQKKGCKTKSIPKDLLEDIIIEETIGYILTDEMIDFIGNCLTEFQEKELDRTMLNVIEKDLKETESGIKNLLKAIEQGIITETTKDRLVELEIRQTQLESQRKIEHAKLNAPKTTKAKVCYWLEKFRDGDIKDPAYRKSIVDLFIYGAVVTPDVITIAYNYSGDKDLLDVDLNELKNSSDSVRMSLINWSLRNNIRTLKSGSVIEFDIKNRLILYSFKRAA